MAAIMRLHRPESPAFAALRARVADIERGGDAPADAPAAAVHEAIDRALPGGGLARGAAHEIAGAADGAADGFAATIAARAAGPRGTVLWCARDGDLYAPGLAAFGLDTARLVTARAPRAEDALQALEEALRAGVAVAVGETSADLVAGRRLRLAARAGGGLCLLLRRPGRPARAEAVHTRWRVSSVPSAPAPGGGPGAPRWRLSLTRCRGAAPREWTVEWSHETHRLTLVAPLANRAGPARRFGRAG